MGTTGIIVDAQPHVRCIPKKIRSILTPFLQGAKMATHERLQRILETDYDLSPEKLALDASLEDLGIDSLGVMELLFKVEDEFHIQVPTFQVSLSTVKDVVDYIDELARAQEKGSGSASTSSA